MAEQNPIRVMIVDDHTVVRSGLGAFLLAYDDLDLVAEANSRDGSDNISAVTVFIEAIEEPQSMVFQPADFLETAMLG